MRTFILMLLLVGFSATQAAQAPDIRSLMTAEDFSAAGLDKLSDEELAQLNEWVARYRDGATKGPAAPKTPQQREEEDKVAAIDIVANVVPAFTGWSGRTIFKLDNGQIWKQRISGSMRYNGDDNTVIISRNFIGKYNLKHKETGRSVGVQRIQ